MPMCRAGARGVAPLEGQGEEGSSSSASGLDCLSVFLKQLRQLYQSGRHLCVCIAGTAIHHRSVTNFHRPGLHRNAPITLMPSNDVAFRSPAHAARESALQLDTMRCTHHIANCIEADVITLRHASGDHHALPQSLSKADDVIHSRLTGRFDLQWLTEHLSCLCSTHLRRQRRV